MPQAGVAASDRFEANRLSLLATGAFRFTAPSKLDLPVSYKIFGSAKLYQWRKGDRDRAALSHRWREKQSLPKVRNRTAVSPLVSAGPALNQGTSSLFTTLPMKKLLAPLFNTDAQEKN